MRKTALVIANLLAASALALALPAAGAPDSNMPAVHEAGEVTYLSGGVGSKEADAIKRVARNYPLELEFLRKAEPKDTYLANIKVRIKDEHEKMVLDVTSDGPFLLAKLPAGKYTVSAERAGKIENRTVQIAANEHRRVVFEWQS